MAFPSLMPSVIARLRHERPSLGLLLALSPAAVYLAVIYVFPVLRVLLMGLFDPDFTLEHYQRLVEVPIYRAVMLNTVEISLTVSLICLILAYPTAYMLSTLRPQLAKILLAFVIYRECH